MRAVPLETDGRGNAGRLRRGRRLGLIGAIIATGWLVACGEEAPADRTDTIPDPDPAADVVPDAAPDPAPAADVAPDAAPDPAPLEDEIPDAVLPAEEETPDPPAPVTSSSPVTGPRGRSTPPAVGTWARYTSTSSAEPRITELVLSCPSEDADGAGIWFELEASAGGTRVLAVSLLAEDLQFLATGAAPGATRYFVHPRTGAALEYVDARTGEALLPAGAAGLFPRGEAGDPWPGSLRFLGRAFERAPDGPAPRALPRDPSRELVLDPDRLVATSRPFREAGPARVAQDGKNYTDYRYVDFSEADYRKLADAGFSLFRVSHAHVAHVVDEPVFFLADKGFREWPDLLFRSNYRGAVMYLDEPALHAHGVASFRQLPDPSACATYVCESVTGLLSSEGRYGTEHLTNRLAETGFEFGEVTQAPYPAWEAIASAAWYDLEGGAQGVCWEAQLVPARFAREIRETLGVEFPDDVAASVDFHVALLRGAARRFDVPWGVSIYGQTDPAAADALFPRAWDAGASYFWLWTSHGDYHVPHARQLELSRALLAHSRAHPRPGTARELTRRARTALVLPWGYLFDDYAFGAESRHDGGQLWRNTGLRLDRENEAGATYREVLAAGMREAVALLERGEPFDVLFLREGERAESYERVRRVGPDGAITP